MSNDFSACDACGNVSEPFWRLADWHYCRKCVSQAGGGDFGPLTHPLVEEARWGCLGTCLLSLWSGFVMSAVLTVVIFTIFSAIILLGLIVQNLQPNGGWRQLMAGWLLFAGFAFCFVSVVGFPTAFILGLVKRPRRISTDGDAFVVETPFSTRRLPFSECLWMTPKFASDGTTIYFPAKPLLVISCIDPKYPMSIVCGFSEPDYHVWKTFVILRGISFKERIPLIAWALRGVIGAFFGAILGMLIGYAGSLATGDARWTHSMAFVGFLDGCAWAVLRTLIDYSPPVVLRKAMSVERLGWAYYYLVFPLTGFVLGLKAGRFDGIAQGLTAGGANALIGAWLGWHCAKAVHKRLEYEGEGAFLAPVELPNE